MQRNFAYMHELCGAPAFFLEKAPDPDDVEQPRSYDVELPDGTKPKPYSVMVCGSCGEPLKRLSILDVKPWKPQ